MELGLDLERKEYDLEDFNVLHRYLARHRVVPGRSRITDHECRRSILISRLQRALEVHVDCLYGPETHEALRKKEIRLGPELTAIVREETVFL